MGGTLSSCKTSIDNVLISRGIGGRGRKLFWHILSQLYENLSAVIPISVLLIVTLLAFFQRAPQDAATMVAGLFSAIVGLVAFAEGLRVLVMPLSEMVGVMMPQKHKLPVVLAVAFVLGVLVTYAEPAIASLMPLADLVDKYRAPYLYFVLNQKRELMVLSIGLGVGLASVIGTLRFMRDWPLKPLVMLVLTPTMALAAYMNWGNKDLQPLIGLSWDCGGVTTGPVTVPVLLALGIGVTRSEREKKRIRKSLFNAVNEHGTTSSTLEGFGLVTLASICPIFAVELMAVCLSIMYTKEQIIADESGSSEDKAVDKSPLKEVIYGFRAILPLLACLLLIVKVLLREDLPNMSPFLPHPIEDDNDQSGGEEMRAAEVQAARARAIAELEDCAEEEDDVAAASAAEEEKAERSVLQVEVEAGGGATAFRGREDVSSGLKERESNAGSDVLPMRRRHTLEEAAHLKELQRRFDDNATFHSLFEPEFEPDETKRWTFWHRYGALIVGYLEVQLGMILFNLGLTYGFTTLADQAGRLLPAAYLSVSYESKSPYFSYAGGLTIVFLVVFLLGFLATRAEPALNVLGRTVEEMSKGSFTRNQLIYAVCVGVGVGMMLGSWKILFNKPLMIIILVKYALATLLSLFVEESFTQVAWDSAGVTTGPVTVPFVLSLGIGFSVAVNSTEGFGMLTTASVAPIIAVQFAKLAIYRDRSKGKTADSSLGGPVSPLSNTDLPSVIIKAPAEGQGPARAAF